MKIGVGYYLEELKRKKIDPNFWISKSYLETCKMEGQMSTHWIWIEEEEKCIFPPLPITIKPGSYPVTEIWALFKNFEPPFPGVKTKLDFEYIYDPGNFLDLRGKVWSVFRKNSKKWGRDKDWRYQPIGCINHTLSNLLVEWLERKSENVHDAEVIVEYVMSSLSGSRKKVLFYKNQAVAINVWDDNYKYINFRYCIVGAEPFLDEFMRLLFYTDPEILSAGKLVNDGGSLDSPGLERFKDKLNPIFKNVIYSWRKFE